MFITQPNLNALRTTFVDSFWGAYDGTPTWWDKVATKITSKNKSNTYGWAAQQLAMRKWVGPRVIQNLAEHSYQVINDKWESTVELDRDDVEDDTLDVFEKVTLPGLAEAARKLPDTMIATALLANGNGFDGVSFFNDAHPTFNATGGGATTYDNNLTATALDLAGINTAVATMSGYIGENGLPLMVSPNLIIVPPQLELAALIVAKGSTYAIPGATAYNSATIENPFKGRFDVLVVPELAGAPTVFYLADTSKSVKPFVYQVRNEPEFTTRVNPEDPRVFDADVFTWGVRARGAAGYTLPFLIAKVTIS